VLKALLAGQTVYFRDYPISAAYHHILPQQEFRLAFAPAAPVRLYCGGNGPKILKIAGEIMDGALIGNHYIPLLRSGRLNLLLANFRLPPKSSKVARLCSIFASSTSRFRVIGSGRLSSPDRASPGSF
jgi:hypothetical protein